MRRSLTALLVTLLLAGSTPFAFAQEGDMAYFEEFDGLQRVIARSWMAPITISSDSSAPVEITGRGTPAATPETVSTHSATPEPQAGVGMFAVFVYLFDSDDNAAAGFDRVDAEFKEARRRDPRTPFNNDVPLDGVGDQAVGYSGDIEQDGVVITYSFATVQDGPFVYSITGMSAGIDADAMLRDTAEALIAQPMNRMAEHFDPNGGSRGGLWSKLDSVHPDVPEGSTVTDLIIYPMPEATPGASPVLEAPMLDLDDPASIDGLATLARRTYTLPGNATPAPDVSGVFRIDTWILTFDSSRGAHNAANAFSNTLIDPFIIIRGGAKSGGPSNGTPFYTSWNEGFIGDRSLPPGNGVVVVQQDEKTLAAVAVYAVGDDPRPIADEVMRSMTADSTIPPDQRFPQAGDPALQGLVSAASPDATATP